MQLLAQSYLRLQWTSGSLNQWIHSGCVKQPWFRLPGVWSFSACIVLSHTNRPTWRNKYILAKGQREWSTCPRYEFADFYIASMLNCILFCLRFSLLKIYIMSYLLSPLKSSKDQLAHVCTLLWSCNELNCLFLQLKPSRCEDYGPVYTEFCETYFYSCKLQLKTCITYYSSFQEGNGDKLFYR